MKKQTLPPGFNDMLSFNLMEGILGRRSRRFFMGAEIPDGVFRYKSLHKPVPLTDLEKMLILSACGGNNSWHHMIYRAARYAPQGFFYENVSGMHFTQIAETRPSFNLYSIWRIYRRAVSISIPIILSVSLVVSTLAPYFFL